MKSIQKYLLSSLLLLTSFNNMPSCFLEPKSPEEYRLEQAVTQGNWEAVKEEVLEGNNPNIKCFNPLMQAIFAGNQEMVHFLVQHGADLNQKLFKEHSDDPGTVWEAIQREKEFFRTHEPEMLSLVTHLKNIDFLKKGREHKSFYH